MKLQITNLKAPWPFGAVAGDVLELPAVPVWAVGKCKHVADDTEPTVAFPQPEPVRDLEAELEEAEGLLQAQAEALSQLRTSLDEAGAKLAEAEAANAALLQEKAAAESAAADLRAKLAEAEAALATASKAGKK